METEVEKILTSLILTILIGTLLHLISKKIKVIPFPVLLFLTGISFSLFEIEFLEQIKLSPESVLFIYLPILLFESAIHFDFREFRRVLVPSFIFATFGLIISSLVVAIPLSNIFGIPFLEALLYGIIASSTDPIAVLSIFKNLGIPKRLQFLVDGESFLNDATSVVLYKIILTLIASGLVTVDQVAEGFTYSDAVSNLGEFIYLLFGGAIFGVIFGWLFSELISYVKNESTIEITLTFILASSIFIISEEVLHVSGIIAVLGAGLILGNYGKNKFSPESKKIFDQTWKQIGFIITSIVFLLVGYEIDFQFIAENIDLVVVGTALLIGGRAIAIYSLGWIYNQFSLEINKIPTKWLTIVNIGGIRGVLPLVILISLEDNLIEYKETFLQLILAAIFITITINTLLISPIIKEYGINKLSFTEKIEAKLTKIIFLRKMLVNLEKIYSLDEICEEVYSKHKKDLKKRLKQQVKHVFVSLNKNEDDYEKQLEKILRLYFIQVEKSSYKDLYSKEVINLDLFERLANSLDLQVEKIKKNELQIREERTNIKNKFKKLQQFNYSIDSFLKRFIAGKLENNVKDTYLYYKARLIGDENVLEEIKEIIKIDTKLFNEHVLSDIQKIYKNLLFANKSTLNYIRSEYSQIVDRVEEEIYEHEFNNLKNKLMIEFAEDDRVSEKALKGLEV